MPSLEYFEPTINAYASILIPRDDGSITITGLAPVGTITINGIVLTAQAGARVTGLAPTFDSSLGTTAAIAGSLRDAINDPANLFLLAGVVATRFSGASVVGLSRTAPTLAIVDACTNLTVLQATLGDFAAGSLLRQVTPAQVETFAAQVIRWIRLAQGSALYWNYSVAVPEGLVDPGFELDVIEDDALILFDELDAQAAFYLGAGARFADLPVGQVFPNVAYPAAPTTQTDVVEALLAGTLVIHGGSGLTAAQMRTIAQVPLVMTAIKAAYWLNYPHHIVWGANNIGVGPSGTGTGEPVFSGNPANQISNPNDRAVVSAFTYRKWPCPIRQGLQDRWGTAMLEVNVNAGLANTEFALLTTEWTNKTMINIG